MKARVGNKLELLRMVRGLQAAARVRQSSMDWPGRAVGLICTHLCGKDPVWGQVEALVPRLDKVVVHVFA